MFGKRHTVDVSEAVVSKWRVLDGDPAAVWAWITSPDAEMAHPDALAVLPVPGHDDTTVTLLSHPRGGCSYSVIEQQPSDDRALALSRDASYQIDRKAWLETSPLGTSLHLELRMPLSAVPPGRFQPGARSLALVKLETYATAWLLGMSRVGSSGMPQPWQRLDQAVNRAQRADDRCRPVETIRLIRAEPAHVWRVLNAAAATSGAEEPRWTVPDGRLQVGSLRAGISSRRGRILAAVDELTAQEPGVSQTWRSLIHTTAPERTVTLAEADGGTRITVVAQAFAELDLWPGRFSDFVDEVQQRSEKPAG